MVGTSRGSVRRQALAVAIALAAAVAVVARAATEEPTPLERILQGRYLDRAVYVRADVKVRTLRSQRVVSSSWPRGANLSSESPSTLVNAEGVFYLDDYGETRELEMDVRPGVVIDPENPADQNQALVQGGTIGDVVELRRDSEIALGRGSLARIVGVAETPRDVRVTLQGLDGTVVGFLVRGAGDAAVDPERRAAAFDELLPSLCFVVPDDPAARRSAADPAWPAAVQTAIREGRVEAGMTAFQALLAWGMPLHVGRDEATGGEIWLYKRGATILDQLRNSANVYLVAGEVTAVEAGD